VNRESGDLTYQPALDGLRALAVAAVIAYHLGAGWARGGFLGVDAFFVLSGFLITSLLLTEWGRHGGISLPRFWVRRARRLLPALFLVLGAIALYAATLAPSHQLRTLRADGLASVFYFANWHFVLSGQSYFDLFTLPSPMRHLWSLAIEEQFYLLWPLVALGCLWIGRGHASRWPRSASPASRLPSRSWRSCTSRSTLRGPTTALMAALIRFSSAPFSRCSSRDTALRTNRASRWGDGPGESAGLPPPCTSSASSRPPGSSGRGRASAIKAAACTAAVHSFSLSPSPRSSRQQSNPGEACYEWHCRCPCCAGWAASRTGCTCGTGLRSSCSPRTAPGCRARRSRWRGLPRPWARPRCPSISWSSHPAWCAAGL
jgi:Acyltransferase family